MIEARIERHFPAKFPQQLSTSVDGVASSVDKIMVHAKLGEIQKLES